MGGAVGGLVSGIGDAIGGAVQGVSDVIHDVGESPIVQTVAPIVATAVGGPLAGAALTTAMSLDQGQDAGTALTKGAVNYGVGTLLGGGDQLTSMEAGIDFGTPDFSSLSASDLSSLEDGIDWGTPNLTAIEKSSLANAFTNGAAAVTDWVANNPLQAASIGLAGAKALTATQPTGSTYTPINWNYIAPQFGGNQSSIVQPTNFAMPEFNQVTQQRDVQLSPTQLMDPSVLAAQQILNRPTTYTAPTFAQQANQVARYQPLVSPGASGKGGVGGLEANNLGSSINGLLQRLL